jgi:hypothetical protein
MSKESKIWMVAIFAIIGFGILGLELTRRSGPTPTAVQSDSVIPLASVTPAPPLPSDTTWQARRWRADSILAAIPLVRVAGIPDSMLTYLTDNIPVRDDPKVEALWQEYHRRYPSGAAAHASRVIASGGLACRDRATYNRLWRKVPEIMAYKGHDSLKAFASQYPGCRTLASDGEMVKSVKLVGEWAVELRLAGDSLPLYAHAATIDTLP